LPTQTKNQRSDMAEDSFSRYLLLPELQLFETRPLGKGCA
jgi:hypothetical protein